MRRSLSLWLAALLVAAAVPAGASTFLALTREEMVARADAVVEGRIVEASSFWNAKHTAILTEAVLEVDAAVVGSAPT